MCVFDRDTDRQTDRDKQKQIAIYLLPPPTVDLSMTQSRGDWELLVFTGHWISTIGLLSRKDGNSHPAAKTITSALQQYRTVWERALQSFLGRWGVRDTRSLCLLSHSNLLCVEGDEARETVSTCCGLLTIGLLQHGPVENRICQCLWASKITYNSCFLTRSWGIWELAAETVT